MTQSFFHLVLLILTLGASPSNTFQQKSPPGEVSSQPVLERSLVVTVTNERGKYVVGLNQDVFTLYEGRTPLEIVSFSNADEPANVGIMFDMSGSMRDVYNFKREEMKDVFKRSVSLLLEKGHPSNEYFVAGFTSDLQVILDRTSDHNTIIQSLDKLFSIASKGQTALYDACYLAMDKAFSGSRRKRALVLFTDGRDNASKHSLNELSNEIWAQDVLFYPIAIFERQSPVSTLDIGERAVVGQMARISGGKVFYPRNNVELDEVMKSIASELRAQYTLGIKLAGTQRKEGRRKIDVRLSPQYSVSGKTVKLSARAREGYYTEGNR
jgi:Ca-activated chloride channel family protein